MKQRVRRRLELRDDDDTRKLKFSSPSLVTKRTAKKMKNKT